MGAQRTVSRPARRSAWKSLGSNWYESPWRIVGSAIGAALAILILGALITLLVIPRLLGGDSLTVLSGSMEPTFSPGDVAVVKGVDEADVCTEVSVGTIVTFFPEPNDPTLITHRVVGKTIGTFEDGTDCRLITQGDANSSTDDPVSPSQVRGIFMYGVPGIGWMRQWVGQNPMLLAAGLAAALIGWGIWSSLRKPRSTVVSVPRPASPRPAPQGTTQVLDTVTPREQELRERELALREREIELRERELEFAMGERGVLDQRPTIDSSSTQVNVESMPASEDVSTALFAPGSLFDLNSLLSSDPENATRPETFRTPVPANSDLQYPSRNEA